MRRRLLTLLLVAMTAITFIVPATAGAGNGTSVTVEKARNAAAYYEVIDGCFETYIDVLAGEETAMSNDENPDTQAVEVLINAIVYDACQAEMVHSIFDTVTDLNVEIASGLNRATVSGTTTVHDFVSGNSIPVAVDLTFDASGTVFHDHDKDTLELPSPDGGTLTIKLHQQVRWRHGVSAGTIAIGAHVVAVATDPETLTTTLFGFNEGQVTLDQ